MKKLTWDIEYRLDSLDNDCDYIEQIPSLKKAMEVASDLKRMYGQRIVSLDVKGFEVETNELIKHLTIV